MIIQKSPYITAALVIALCMAQDTFSMEKSDSEREYREWLKQYDEHERYFGTKPMLDAVRTGRIDLVRTMIEKKQAGINTSTLQIGGPATTPLMEAAFHGHDAIVDLLIEHGAAVPGERELKEYSSHPSAKNLRTEKEVRDLILPKGWKHAYDLLKTGPIDYADFRGLLRSLSGYGMLHSMKDARGNTLLHLAIIKRNWDIANFILELDPKTAEISNKFGVTPFELGYGLYLEEDKEWNAFIKNHESSFGVAIAQGKQKWKSHPKEAYKEGIEGMKVE